MRQAIAIGLCSVLAVTGLSKAAQSQTEVKAEETRSLAWSGARGLRVETRDGAVRVAGAAGGDQLVIHATKRVRAGDRRQAEAFLQQVTLRCRREGDHWTIAALWPDRLPEDIQGVGVSLDLRIPREMELEAKTRNGLIEVSGVGQCRLRTSDGPIQARHVSGGVDAETSNGPIHLEACAGPVAARTRSGPLQILQAQDTIKATTSNGPVGVEVTEAGQAAQIELETSNGPIELVLPERVSARLEASTSASRIHLDPPVRARANADQTHLEAVLGGGAGVVRLRTSNGPIHIRLAASKASARRAEVRAGGH